MAKKKTIGAAKPKAEVAAPEAEVTVGKGEKVVSEVAIPEVASIKVRSAKGGVKMMTPTEYAEYCENR